MVVGDEQQDVLLAEGLLSQRSFRAADPRTPDREPLHTVTFALQVEHVEPLEAAPWLGESVVFERRATRQDAELFAGARIRSASSSNSTCEARLPLSSSRRSLGRCG